MTATQAGYTEGPWRVGDAGATVFGPPNGNPSPEIVAGVKRKANARLIAAAPEMLAALKSAIEWAEYTGGWDGDAWSEIRAAIAKATGHA